LIKRGEREKGEKNKGGGGKWAVVCAREKKRGVNSKTKRSWGAKLSTNEEEREREEKEATLDPIRKKENTYRAMGDLHDGRSRGNWRQIEGARRGKGFCQVVLRDRCESHRWSVGPVSEREETNHDGEPPDRRGEKPSNRPASSSNQGEHPAELTVTQSDIRERRSEEVLY